MAGSPSASPGGEGVPDAPLRVALTFDAEHPDRPTVPGVQEGILDELSASDVRATFFVQGRWAEAYPGTARRILHDGHLVGSHSHYHARLPLLSKQGLDVDVRTAESVIRDVVGVDPRPWFRCPFGAGQTDPRLLAQLGVLGYKAVGWHVGPLDWDPASTGVQVENRVVEGAQAHGDGAIVLLHAWPQATLKALPGMIGRLRERGASFVAVHELPSPVTSEPGDGAVPVAPE